MAAFVLFSPIIPTSVYVWNWEVVTNRTHSRQTTLKLTRKRMGQSKKYVLLLSSIISIVFMCQFQPILFNYYSLAELSTNSISIHTTNSTTTTISKEPTTDDDEEEEEEDTRLPSMATSKRLREELIEENRKQRNNMSKEPIQIFHRAVSGLGHRIGKMTSAYHLVGAMNLTNGLSNSWGWECQGKKENSTETMDIFYYLFGDDLLSVPTTKTQRPMIDHPYLVGLRRQITDASARLQIKDADKGVRIINEIPGYMCLTTAKQISELPLEIMKDKVHSDFELYTRLRGLFRDNDVALDFIQQHNYTDHYVFGLHIRAGNGEKGHFQDNLREIYNLEEWISNFAKMMLEYVTTEEYRKLSNGKPPLLFVATDTAKSIDLLQTQLSNHNIDTNNENNNISSIIPVIHFSQEYMKDGEGVSYRAKHKEAQECYQSWSNQFMDMTLLSASDVVIAGMYSSFTQSMPMKIMIANPVEENNKMFCEVGRTAKVMHCMTRYADWLAFHTNNKKTSKYTVIGSKVAEAQKFESRQDFPIYDIEQSPGISHFLKSSSSFEKSEMRRFLIPTKKK